MLIDCVDVTQQQRQDPVKERRKSTQTELNDTGLGCVAILRGLSCFLFVSSIEKTRSCQEIAYGSQNPLFSGFFFFFFSPSFRFLVCLFEDAAMRFHAASLRALLVLVVLVSFHSGFALNQQALNEWKDASFDAAAWYEQVRSTVELATLDDARNPVLNCSYVGSVVMQKFIDQV
jgi:hypothetical protein